LAAAKALSDDQLRREFQIGQGSIWKSLLHLYAAESVWLEQSYGCDGHSEILSMKFRQVGLHDVTEPDLRGSGSTRRILALRPRSAIAKLPLHW